MLYLTLFKEFRTSLIPVVLEMVEAVRAPCNPEDIIGILSKDAGGLKDKFCINHKIMTLYGHFKVIIK